VLFFNNGFHFPFLLSERRDAAGTRSRDGRATWKGFIKAGCVEKTPGRLHRPVQAFISLYEGLNFQVMCDRHEGLM
jgi:hypothetical protein